MKKPCANLHSMLMVFLVSLGLAACSAVATPESTHTASVQPTVTASATAQTIIDPTSTHTATARPSPIASATAAVPTATATPTRALATPTPAATVTELPPPQPPTPTVQATPAPLALAGPIISYNGIQFNVDPVLGDRVYAHAASIGEVDFARFTFAPDGWCREVGCVEVYPVEEYQAAFPGWSLPPLGAATLLRAQDQSLVFQNGAGARSIRMRGQDGFFANNEALVYDFQGFTADDRYYVSVIIPIDAPILLSTYEPQENTNAAALPVPTELPSDYDQLVGLMREYNQQAERELDLLAATDFTPGLDALDALVTSLRIEAPPADMPGPTPAPPVPIDLSASSLRQVGLVPPALLGRITGMRAAPDGSLWVFASHGSMVLREGNWTVQPLGREQILVGVDDALRAWFFIEGDERQIFSWDGGPEFTLADAGWIPVLDPAMMRGRGVLTDPDGRVWLATEQDVRMFDGTRWRVFALEDMGMTPPPHPDFATMFTLALMGEPGHIWVGECHWIGPGPAGGGGARWFDGQAWRGAESPVASGCVTAIQADSLGRVWVGADADLWRYDPALDDWQRFAPPSPPQGYRFGNITDIALDAANEPWPLFALCGGASCVNGEVRYRLREGVWTQIGEISDGPQSLVFDGAGTPWFYANGEIHGIQDDQIVEPPIAIMAAQGMAVDASGWVWVAGWQIGIIGQQAASDVGLWVLESVAGAADALAVCPQPNERQPRPFKVWEGQSVVANFEPQIRDYLQARGSAQGLQAALSDLTLPDDGGADWQSRTQVFSADVSGDGVPEVVLDLSFFVEGQYAEGAIFVHRCQAGQYVGGAVANIGGQVFSAQDPDPGIRAIQDMNGDGISEIVFSYIAVAGTHANFSREFRILEWDGDAFVDLIQGGPNRPYAAQVLNGDGAIHDKDGDGIMELELTHGAGRHPDASALDRGDIDVWAWDDSSFTLASTEAAPPLFRIHAVWDGDAATLRGDYEAALALYQRAIFDEALLGWRADYAPGGAFEDTSADPDERARLSAYSRYRIMLLHIARGYLPEAGIVYDTLQEKFPQEVAGHAYAALATAFWDAYNDSGDIVAACAQAVGYADVHHGDILSPLGSAFYGSAQRDYTPEDVCPFKETSP